jgi:hypothetical protein
VADGVNVDFDVYRIRTRIGEAGSRVEAGYYVDRRDRETRGRRWEQLDEDLVYDATALDREVVAPDQIRAVVRTFRDKLPESPGRRPVSRVEAQRAAARPERLGHEALGQVRGELLGRDGRGEDYRDHESADGADGGWHRAHWLRTRVHTAERAARIRAGGPPRDGSRRDSRRSPSPGT